MKASQIQKLARSSITFTQDIHQAAQLVKMGLGMKGLVILSEHSTDHREFFVASGSGLGFEITLSATNNGDDTFKLSCTIQNQ